MKRPVGVSMGDPAGIGPEVFLKAFRKLSSFKQKQILLIGDKAYVEFLRKRLKLPALKNLVIVDLQNISSKSFVFGKPDRQAGKASGEYIREGIQMAMNREIRSLVTAPINKQSFRKGGWGRKYIGHTEMLAGLTKSSFLLPVVQVGAFRSAQVTAHIPLKSVSRHLTSKKVFKAIEVAHDGLRRLGIRRPKIAVPGLNPHAGDDGILGLEEKKVLAPAIKRARNKGIRATGPLSPDVVWPRVLGGEFDLGLGLYHDQSQIPVKLLSWQRSKSSEAYTFGGVLVTMGLPFLRVSPFHGTGYDIAGKGLASEQSMLEALNLALSQKS